MRIEITKVLQETGDKFEDLQTTLTEEEIDRELDIWEKELITFYGWSPNYVYFVVFSDRGQRISYVPRNPTDIEPSCVFD